MKTTEAGPRPARAAAVNEALHRVRRRGARWVDFWFTDADGRPWRITLNAERLDERVFASGVVLDGPSIGPSWEGFIVLLPDPEAVYAAPLAASPTATVFCDVALAAGADARTVLKRAEARVIASGAAAQCVLGAEAEFFLLERGAPAEEDSLREFLRRLAVSLGLAGVSADWFRVGPAPGQGRVQMRAASAVRTADRVVLYKEAARALAAREGREAAFRPKPLPGPGSAALLVHHALWRDDRNLFHDAAGWEGTSALARWYAGGLLAHAPALLAFCAPTAGSYRRLAPGEGPVDVLLAKERRSAVCRVPAGSIGPAAESRRVKFCAADATCNPYLALAAMLMAGHDGVERRLEPPLEGRVERPARLPGSLAESLAALEADADFLKKGGVFDDALIRGWIDERRAAAA